MLTYVYSTLAVLSGGSPVAETPKTQPVMRCRSCHREFALEEVSVADRSQFGRCPRLGGNPLRLRGIPVSA